MDACFGGRLVLGGRDYYDNDIYIWYNDTHWLAFPKRRGLICPIPVGDGHRRCTDHRFHTLGTWKTPEVSRKYDEIDEIDEVYDDWDEIKLMKLMKFMIIYEIYEMISTYFPCKIWHYWWSSINHLLSIFEDYFPLKNGTFLWELDGFSSPYLVPVDVNFHEPKGPICEGKNAWDDCFTRRMVMIIYHHVRAHVSLFVIIIIITLDDHESCEHFCQECLGPL